VNGFVQVKNFERFQHYKDRDPPWIKLYVRLLDDYAFSRLPDAHKAHLVLIWVLASKTENKIPADSAWISARIGATEPVNLSSLLEAGFLEEWQEQTARGKRQEWASRYVAAQTRADLLSLAQHKCADCPSTTDLEIDHIVPISKGGTGAPDNLQVLCRKCNRKKRVRLKQEAAEHLRSKPLRRTSDQRSPETETEKKTEQKRETWLTPFGDAWQARCGNPPFGRLARDLAPLVKQLGEPEALARWSRYLDATEPRYCAPARFVATHAAYAGPETQEMTDEFGQMRLHRKNGDGKWEIAS
jgi:hypothetical protein